MQISFSNEIWLQLCRIFLSSIRWFVFVARNLGKKGRKSVIPELLERTYYRSDSKRPAISEPKQILDVTSDLEAKSDFEKNIVTKKRVK